MGLGDDTDDNGTLLHGLLCILDLEDAALGRAASCQRCGYCGRGAERTM